MIKEGNKLYSILYFKCPQCHKGNLYINQNPYSFNDFFEMHPHCDTCGLKYEKEPGFFFGAMFVSYALSITLAGITWFILTFLGFNFKVIIWTIIPVLIVAIPLLFKLSRSVWLNFFTNFDPQFKLK